MANTKQNTIAGREIILRRMNSFEKIKINKDTVDILTKHTDGSIVKETIPIEGNERFVELMRGVEYDLADIEDVVEEIY